ncbi:MAG: tRNA preQ1(34) S-adenosylmethionine ribosyltransferase-isomerase QueA, partial [Pseudomonadota bacterium]|nr:tRNA preQ1(34) S-adenosylmethionine ribosyltransferase-isomerase QueA [Pseudomonadota bacterium]
MLLSDFDYELPDALIARHPPAQRGASRLLDLRGMAPRDTQFAELPELMGAGDLLVLNDTRVLKARLFGRKPSGGRVEVVFERPLGNGEWAALLRASHAPRPGSTLELGDGVAVEVVGREGDLFRLRAGDDAAMLALMERCGELPLPPYLERAAEAEDEQRYQTVYARAPGAVAAPTAGLHFDQAMLEVLRARGVEIASVTLHVGAGTFQPVRVDDIAQHVMHPERYWIPPATRAAVAAARDRGARICAVGTTSLRALEAAAQEGRAAELAEAGDTRLFITPGYRFRVVDRLLTNFHLPRSTLLMLVQAFGGVERLRAAYGHAVA